uniref:Uncharacterized protein n=1 Tax=Echinococcus granulosus TaxID=6210 RepID=A0A068W9I4_ECHGR|nr:hypothetical protein EgrG_000870500 [Echinococcus granulosus]
MYFFRSAEVYHAEVKNRTRPLRSGLFSAATNVTSRDFPADQRRHNTRAEYVYSAQRRYLGYWHSPKTSPSCEAQEGKLKSPKGRTLVFHMSRGNGLCQYSRDTIHPLEANPAAVQGFIATFFNFGLLLC